MRLLMAARRYPPDVRSGTETVFEALYQAAQRRHEVRLVAGWRQSAALLPPEAVGVRLRGLPRPAGWLAMAAAIRAEIASFKPEVVLSNSIEVPPSGVPTAAIVHDLNFGGLATGWESQARRRFYALRASALSGVIAVSHATASALQALGVPENKITTIQNGVDLEHFRPRAPGAPPPIPLGPADRLQLLYPARILPGKGQHLAIDAVARLRRDLKERVWLTLVGAADDRPYLDQIRLQAYKQPVSFALDVPDMAPYLQSCDVVLFPTVMEEGFGFTAVEGMACGKPVIWFDQPAVREATGGMGLAVPRGDVDGLRAAILRCLEAPEERARLGAEGRAWCEAHRGWAAAWSRYEALLSRLAG